MRAVAFDVNPNAGREAQSMRAPPPKDFYFAFAIRAGNLRAKHDA
jgi:hypothetical protein